KELATLKAEFDVLVSAVNEQVGVIDRVVTFGPPNLQLTPTGLGSTRGEGSTEGGGGRGNFIPTAELPNGLQASLNVDSPFLRFVKKISLIPQAFAQEASRAFNYERKYASEWERFIRQLTTYVDSKVADEKTLQARAVALYQKRQKSISE